MADFERTDIEFIVRQAMNSYEAHLALGWESGAAKEDIVRAMLREIEAEIGACCTVCGGSGRTEESRCPNCLGTGKCDEPW